LNNIELNNKGDSLVDCIGGGDNNRCDDLVEGSLDLGQNGIDDIEDILSVLLLHDDDNWSDNGDDEREVIFISV